MSNREQFEAWMTAEQAFHGSDFEWDERRNCYSEFGIHLAYKAFQASSTNSEAKITALTSQLESVVAENAALKESRKNLAEFIHEELDAGYPLNMNIETTSTDAILAEVRASGVEMYAENLDSSADDAERDGFDDAVKFLRSEASAVRLFAAQLRQEAK